MNDAADVRELHREADVDERAQHALLGRLVAIRHERCERGAGDLLHHEERQVVVVAADLVDRHDRGMLEPALHRRFAQEPRDRALARVRRTHPLDRDVAADLLVARGHHLAHATLADPPPESIALRDDRIARLGPIGRVVAVLAGDRNFDRRRLGLVHVPMVTPGYEREDSLSPDSSGTRWSAERTNSDAPPATFDALARDLRPVPHQPRGRQQRRRARHERRADARARRRRASPAMRPAASRGSCSSRRSRTTSPSLEGDVPDAAARGRRGERLRVRDRRAHREGRRRQEARARASGSSRRSHRGIPRRCSSRSAPTSSRSRSATSRPASA